MKRGFVFLALTLIVGGCGRGDSAAPPRVHLGEDSCAVCHMIVSDGRFAAAASVRDSGGRVDKPVFDDIGCMFLYEQSHPQRVIIARHVRHVDRGVWIDADEAVYVHSDRIVSPMAYGIAALSDRSEAEVMRDEHGGEVLGIEDARRRVLGDDDAPEPQDQDARGGP